MKTVTIDIETIPSQKPGLLEEIRANIQPPGNISKPETIAKWIQENAETAAEETYRKTALNGTLGEIVCISYAVGDAPPLVIWRDCLSPEKEMLREFFGKLHGELDLSLPCFVGHNILGFDLRFIFQRAVINGIKPPFPLRQDARYSDNEKIFDTMLAWAGWGNRCRLATICEALGIPVKSDGIDGSKVWDEVKAGNAAAVAAYCMEDVTATREVYKRMTFQEVLS